MTDTAYLLGVDTGGTYTDAAVIDASTHTVIASAKALTTRGDLSVGVAEAIRAAVARLPDGRAAHPISLVAVSTTLATNAVVEGHGGATAMILVGFDPAMAARTGIAAAFPGMPLEIVGGGHDHGGAERAPLDEDAVIAAIDRHAGSVEAFAVAGQFAVRNPAHEQRVRDLVVSRTDRPVTISTELSSALDAPRRALTAALNARLISRISRLIDAVAQAMADLGIRAPLMIVKGDGTLALASAVKTRPIETVLSGPAASLVGARWLSGLGDFILADMGGTTTDLAVFTDGRARISNDGADLGGWRTMVRAIDVRTVGLGGDSEIGLGPKGEIDVGPARVLPVSLIGAQFPEVLEMLDHEIAAPNVSSQAGRFVMRPFGWRKGDAAAAGVSAREAALLEQVGVRPAPVAGIAVSPSTQRTLAVLRARGLVQIAGLTPSDAAHVLGLQDNWSRAAAEKAVALAVRFRDMHAPDPARIEATARAIWSETVRRTARVVVETALGIDTGVATGSTPGIRAAGLVDAVCRGESRIGLASVSIAPAVPVVAVGGPVRVYFGEVGRRLGGSIVFPPFCDVANAVGAATATVARSVSITVTTDGKGGFRVHAPDGVLQARGGAEAIEIATDAARRAALASAREMGAAEPEVRVEVVRRLLPGASDDSGLFDATITAEASGRPNLAGLAAIPT